MWKVLQPGWLWLQEFNQLSTDSKDPCPGGSRADSNEGYILLCDFAGFKEITAERQVGMSVSVCVSVL